MTHDTAPGFQRIHLERLKLAADVILSAGEAIGDALEAELTVTGTAWNTRSYLPARPGRQPAKTPRGRVGIAIYLLVLATVIDDAPPLNSCDGAPEAKAGHQSCPSQ